MINQLKELFWFRLLDRCPLCHTKTIDKGYGSFFTHYKKCPRCNWGG